MLFLSPLCQAGSTECQGWGRVAAWGSHVSTFQLPLHRHRNLSKRFSDACGHFRLGSPHVLRTLQNTLRRGWLSAAFRTDDSTRHMTNNYKSLLLKMGM
jgi:hypothetical protein